MEKERAKFLAAYAKVPEPLRDEIVVVIDGETYTWTTAYLEIKEKTELGKKILNTLLNMKIVWKRILVLFK